MKVRFGILMFALVTVLVIGLAQLGEKVSLPKTVKPDPFMFVFKSVTAKVCSGDKCSQASYASTGSGFVMGHNGKDTFVMTAGHICEEDEGVEVVSSKIKVWTYSGQVLEVKVLNLYPADDVCVVVIKDRQLSGYSVSSTKPSVGERVWSLAAPRGIWGPRMTPIFDGYYSGMKQGWDAYTIPVAGGSSGSPILNEHGHIVGMTVAKYRGFENFGLSSPYESVLQAYKDVGFKPVKPKK